ncbi:hypothetical protein J4Q44_G00225620 [Coregonus suidteri]|uniref:NRDE-2, necessary for RNA interference, domain containing n=1 Tax=Coregonus suidteri TaxID=861788 RepID=A0AAN8QIS9_9TELE
MALFPVFAGLSNTKPENAPKELEWLSNQRFCTDNALSVLQLATDDLLKNVESTPPSEEAQCQVEGYFVWLDDLQTLTDWPFCVDRRADCANWEYRSLYRGDIARYKRKGRSSLGLDPRSQAVSCCCGLWENPRCLDQASWVNPLGVDDSSTSLWLQGKAEQGKAVEQPSTPRVNAAALLAERLEDFNRRLRETPTDTQTWLQFVHFQDEVASTTGVFGDISENETERRKRSVRATLEKKVAILDRAVDSIPRSVELKLERLRLCRELWEPAALLKEWKKLVFLHPNSAPLWRKYLLFVQSHFSTFSVSKVNAVYGKCLSTLAAVQDGSMLSHRALPSTDEHMLAIFLQKCHFLRQAGHSEKAVCLFQGLLDFTFFKPDTVKDLPTRQQALPVNTTSYDCLLQLFERCPVCS